MIFHVLNRANDRGTIFETAADYSAFLRVMCDTLAKRPVGILAYCLMPNHWHLVVQPAGDRDLGAFMQLLTTTHVRRWRLHRQTVGNGHLYQGAYKSFAIEQDEHFYTVCRYVERNALRAALAQRAEDWPWASLWQRVQSAGLPDRPALAAWPLKCPETWADLVNQPQTEAELAALRTSIALGRPFGSVGWQMEAKRRLGMSTAERGQVSRRRVQRPSLFKLAGLATAP